MSCLPAFPPSASSSSTAEQPHQGSTGIPTTLYCKDRRHMLHFQAFPPPPYPQLNLQRRKAKRVSDPLNEAVRSRLCGNSTDDAHTMETPTAIVNPAYSGRGIESSTLTDMRFLEDEEDGCSDCSRPVVSQRCGSDGESSRDQHSIPFLEEQLCQMLEDVCSCSTKLEVILLRDITKALGTDAERTGLSTHNEGHGKSHLRRFVMKSLRSAGYNAGICMSRWEKANGYPAGDYEFIDVIVETCSSNPNNNCDRFLVDIDFRSQFEIARPTLQYSALVEVLPTLFVGRADKLRYVIKIMCDAAKRSLKAQGMHLPPWRKYRYVEAKWLGSYNRTTNAVASGSTERTERQLLLREFGGIASFKGMGGDAGFTHQKKLQFEKVVREANIASQEKEKEKEKEKLRSPHQGHQRHTASIDLRFWENERKYRVRGKRESPVLKISGLAAALAKAAIHTASDVVH